MAIEIYKNDEDDILFGQDGNVFRTPYDFGRYFKYISGSDNMYFTGKSPIRNINDGGFTVILLTAKTGMSNNNNRGVFRFESLNYKCALGVGWRYSSHGVHIDYNKALETTYGAGTTAIVRPIVNVAQSFDLFSIYFSNSRVEASVNASSYVGIDVYSLIFTNEDYLYFTIGRGAKGINSYENPVRCLPLGLNRVYVFNRSVSVSELSYLYSNASGNNLMSTQGLIKNNYLGAVLATDFSVLQDSSDLRPGSVDAVNYLNNMELINLPAGTVQQKVDYANANLFVPFIS